MRKTLFGATCGIVIVLGTAIPASAASSGGATHDQQGCQDFGYFTSCFSGHDEYNVTLTPSGYYSYESSGRFTGTTTFDDGAFDTFTANNQYHTLLKSTDVQEYSNRIHGTDTFLDRSSGAIETCIYDVDEHYANGQVQFENYNVTCTP
jgi:hypothetical protein